MGYDVRFDDGSAESEDWVFAFGSATALDAIRQWVETFPAGACSRLRALATTLTTENTLELSAELEAALEVFPPPAWVRPILEEFLERMGDGDEGESAILRPSGEFPQSAADRAAVESATAGDGDTAEKALIDRVNHLLPILERKLSEP